MHRGPNIHARCTRTDAVVPLYRPSRYLIIGFYVGAVTAAGFIWWFLYAQVSGRWQVVQAGRCGAWRSGGAAGGWMLRAAAWRHTRAACRAPPHWSPPRALCRPQAGPGLTWRQLRDFQHCQAGGALDCRVFKDRHPSTIRCMRAQREGGGLGGLGG